MSVSFLSDLSGTPTTWALNGEPPSSGFSTNNSITNLQDLEFLHIAGMHILYNRYPSFPVEKASTTLTPSTARIQHNAFFGYVIPQTAEILGFSVNVSERANNAIFYVFGWDPAANNGNGAVLFTQPINASSTYELMSSGTTYRDTLNIKAGSYLFACQYLGSSQTGLGAVGVTHITAYLRIIP